jgi:thiosulfate reductase cytochrome b subunit
VRIGGWLGGALQWHFTAPEAGLLDGVAADRRQPCHGVALYKPVQLSWLVDGLGGFRLVRIWHFVAMCGLLAFIPGHLVMVVLHGWRNFASMWTGGKGRVLS